MHQLIDKKNKVAIYFLLFIILSTINTKSLAPKESNFNTINNIDVSGLSDDNNLLIANKLNQLSVTNIMFVSQNKIKEVLSQFNLIESYTVKKIYPSKIYIEIEQTKFIAKILGIKKFLVGSNGKLINDEKTEEVLPVFFGEFDSEKFLVFRKIIEESQFNFSDFKSIFFYRSYRWDVLTIDGTLIKLPKKNLSETLKIAYEIIKNDQFNSNRVIDLRISNRIISEK